MKRLFESGAWSVTGEVRGKKDYPANISVRGKPTDAGAGRVMLAVGGGTVTESGMCYGTQRKERLGMHVTYVTDDGLTCTYFRLGEVYVRAGDRVDDGQPLGKASWQEDARVEMRRNGRRIDVMQELEDGVE